MGPNSASIRLSVRRKCGGDLGLIERDAMPRVVVNGQLISPRVKSLPAFAVAFHVLRCYLLLRYSESFEKPAFP
jgi:hypothetical protein